MLWAACGAACADFLCCPSLVGGLKPLAKATLILVVIFISVGVLFVTVFVFKLFYYALEFSG